MDWSDLERPLRGSEKIVSKKGIRKGSHSTERTRTVQNPDGTYMNVNTLWKTKQGTVSDVGHMSDDWLSSHARNYEKKSGEMYPRFKELDLAVEMAKRRSFEGGNKSKIPLTIKRKK